MKREDILSEMKAALARYRTIEEDQFYFGKFVISFDNTNNCGTTCCLWGWEPKFKVLPVEWIALSYSKIDKTPEEIFNWGEIIDYLYYSSSESSTFLTHDEKPYEITGYYLSPKASLKFVLAAWEKTIELIETTHKLDQFLNLY